MIDTMYIPLGDYIDALWPQNLLEPPSSDLLDGVWIEPLNIVTEPEINVKTSILLERELGFTIPGVDGVSIVFAAAGDDSAFLFEFFTNPSPGMRIVDIPIAIRFAKDLLQPAKLGTDAQGNPLVQPDPSLDHVDITLAKITLSVDFDGGFGIEAEGGIDLPLCLIGDTGVGIEARGIRFVGASDAPPPGKPAGWTGIHIQEAGLWLPGDLGATVGHLALSDATIGHGGFSGTVSDTWAPPLAASLGGMDLTLNSVGITFVQNSLTGCDILGTLNLPFFDAPVDVEVGINLDGSFAVRLGSPSGLLTLTKPDILELQVESLGLAFGGGTFTASLSGKVRPLVGGLDWPGFEVKELSIDSKGNVRLEGGWIDLRDGYALDFHGFKIEISKIGFGKNDDGGKWVGFSGGLNLVDGLSAGASVEGLKVTWYEDGSRDPHLSLDGVGVELVVPDALSLKGHVSYREFVDVAGAQVRQFDGDVRLKLLSLGLEIDAVLVIGSALKPDGSAYTFFAIYLAVELPAGIPLWSTGLALYGLAGLFALQMEPDKHADEEWYGVGPSDGWYKRPEIGVTDLGKKWRNQEGSLALGGGLTLGTVADNGFTFSGRMLLVLVFPGPILMIEGKANLLKERSKLSDEPIFRALAVLDGRAGTLLFGLDAQYKVADGGELLDIRGGVEAYFDFHDLDRWHLYLGIKDPKEKRIRARLFDLFEADTYFMLDAFGVRTGAWVGYDKTWKFGPVRITLEAWLETNVAINRKPIHFHGDLWAHGKVGMKVFGFGFGLSLDAKLAGDVFDPFHILAELSVELDLPWPLPNVGVDFSLEWGPEPTPPPIPMVLKEVAIEHFKVTTSWPLPRTSLLLPNYDDGNGFIAGPAGATEPADLGALPIVPLDARPHLTFGRPVHDAALVGTNPQPPIPATERLGDPTLNQGPAQVRYTLRAVTLEKRVGAAWNVVARKGETPNPTGLPELYGSWAPVPADFGGSVAGAVAQVKLWLWSKNPFDYTRVTSGSWDEWFTEHYPDYPCIPDAPDVHVCCDFTRYLIGQSPDPAHSCGPEMAILAFPPKLIHVERLQPPVEGTDRAACFGPESFFGVKFSRPAHRVEILLAADNKRAQAVVTLKDGTSLDGFVSQGGKIVIEHEGIDSVVMRGVSGLCVVRVCADLGPDPDEVAAREEMAQHLQASTALWSGTGAVLEPNAAYRIGIQTQALATGEGELASWSSTREMQEWAYFRTEGPPGLAALSVPLGAPDPEKFDSGLADLARYVAQTVPATVPPPGQKALLPKPVYRAYDVGVAFNEDYVDQMYRMDGRDLGLYLFDNNNQPVRGTDGRILVRPNAWGKAGSVTFDASENRWIGIVNASTCALIGSGNVPKDVTLASSAEGQVLKPDAVHQARLTPLLIHETFAGLTVGQTATGTGARLGRWQVLDQGTLSGPSNWSVAETGSPAIRYVVQNANVYGGTIDGVDPVKPGTMLVLGGDPNLPAGHADQPSNWTDYRLTAYLRNEDDDAIGLVFRYADASNYYRFSMDADRGYRRLVRVTGGVHTILAEDDRRYQKAFDYAVTVEAIGPSLRVYLDGEPILEGNDPAHAQGGIGLYAWASQGARFFDIAVDDFRTPAPGSDATVPVYRFPFTTSKFAHFAHHLHSFDDRVWSATLDPGAPTSSWVTAASLPTAAIADGEARAFDALAHAALGSAADEFPKAVEVTRVEQNGQAVGFLVQTSEPIDWGRTGFDLLNAPRRASITPVAPSALKLTSAAFAQALPKEEAVGLMTRDDLDLRGYAVERFAAPGPIKGSSLRSYLDEDFSEDGHGVLFEETFGPNALDRYQIVGPGPFSLPPMWSVTGGEIRQTSNVGGGSVAASEISKVGTMAVTGDPAWGSIRIRARLVSTDDDAIGIVFRYRDAKNFYRFSTDHERGYRRLVKCVDGVFSLLWEDAASSYDIGVAFEVQIDAFGSRLVGTMNRQTLFDVEDDGLKLGRVGLYSWLNVGARFAALRVESLDADPVLLRPSPASLAGWTSIDPESALDGPSAWSADAAGVHQGSAIRADGAEKIGAHLVTGGLWDDAALSLTLASTEGGAMGALIRYVDGRNYYRFSMHRDEGYRRLVKCVDGVVTTLWEAPVGFDLGRTYRLSLAAEGSTIRADLDGSPLFSVVDASHSKGRVGLYTWKNAGAIFGEIRVLSLARQVGSFRVFDAPGLAPQSSWRTRHGELAQRSPIGSSVPPNLGTHAVSMADVPATVRLMVDATSDGDAPFGVLFRYADERNYYRLSVSTADHVRRLVKMVDGAATTLWEAAGGYAPGRPHRLTVDALGSRLIGYLDGERLFDLTDEAHPDGRVGVYASRNGVVAFDRVQAVDPPPRAYPLLRDRFAQGDAAGWSFVSDATLGGAPHWAPVNGELVQTSGAYRPPTQASNLAKRGVYALAGDPAWTDLVFRARLRSDGRRAVGVIFRYQDLTHYYRFSMDGTQKYRRLVKNMGGTFKLLWQDDFAIEAGRSYEVVVVARGAQLWGYVDGIPVFAVEDGDLKTGRIGLYCWRNPGARFSGVEVLPPEAAWADWAFKDDFPYLVVDRWRFVDAGDVDGPSQWTVEDGRLVQKTPISGDEPRKGTYAVSDTGSRDWRDVRLSALLTSSTEGTRGVAFRFKDAENHYRIEFGKTGRRLVRVVSGTETELWGDAAPYVAGQALMVTAECVGSRISCFVNGVPTCEVVDGSLGAGRIALFAFADAGAAFGYVRVQEAGWQGLYRFDKGPTRPAGYRMRLAASSPDDAPAAVPNLHDVFLAGPGEGGDLHFRGDACDLRTVDPKGRVVHARTFLRDGLYAPVVGVSLLRRPDGCGFFVAVPAAVPEGSRLPEAEYRMRLTYRRDNTATDPGSTILREAGDATPEVAQIDLPW